jgi:hypothetical protein
VLKRLFGIGSEELGRLEVPGETVVALPGGTVKLRYQQKRESVQRAPMGVPELALSIVSVEGGEALELKPPRIKSGSSGKGVQTMPLGTVEVEVAGSYRVSVANPVERSEPLVILLA